MGSSRGPARIGSDQTLCPPSPLWSTTGDRRHSLRESHTEGSRGVKPSRSFDEEDLPHHPATSDPISPESSSTARTDSGAADQSPGDKSPGSDSNPACDHFLKTKSTLYKILFVTVCCATQLIVQAQVGLVTVPLYDIGPWLGTEDPGELAWMSAAYGLTLGIFVVMSGRAGDIFGPKLVWSAGALILAISNLGSGFCKSPVPFDVTRALAGLGAALALPNALAILGRTYPPGKMRNIVFAILGALAPAGFMFGGAIAAVFAVLVDVRWIWWFVAIFTFAFLLLGLYILPPDSLTSPPNQAPLSSRMRQFDYIGSVLLVFAMGLFNFVWNQAALAGWETVYVYVLLIVSVICFVAFFYWEKHVGKTALIPIEVLSKQSLLVYLSLWLGWTSFGTFLFYTMRFIHDIRGQHNVLVIAAQLAPLAPGGIIAALLVPVLIHRIPGHVIFLLAMIAFFIGVLFAAVNPADQIYWGLTFWSVLLVVFGPDLSFSTGQLIVSNSVAHEFQGIAAGIVSMITNYSLSIGLGMAGTVERYISPPQPNPTRSQLLKGYRAAFYLATGMAALAIVVVALFVRMPKQMHGHEKQVKEKVAEEGESPHEASQR
ncbi:hypothetical protein IAU60_001544 [Kwoniella sp. DSM 27419]